MRLFHDADAGQRLVGKPGVLFMEEAQQAAPQRRARQRASMTLRKTDMRSTRLNCWKTMPISARMVRMSRLITPLSWMRCCATSIRPPSASPGMSPAIWRIRVDFPEPDEPMSATISPGLMCRLTRSSPFPPENVLLRVSMWIMLNSSLVVGRIVEEPCDAGVSAFCRSWRKGETVVRRLCYKTEKSNKS